MKKYFLLLSLLFLTSGAVFGDAIALSAQCQRVLQDAKTKVTYYVESDLRHIAAISPDGKLLWCTEVPLGSDKSIHIYGFRYSVWQSKDESILLFGYVSTSHEGMGSINKKTGVVTGVDVN